MNPSKTPMASSTCATCSVPAEGSKREVRMSIKEVAKKLSLWDTATFQPIITHDELEPILTAAGFVPLPVSGEKERPPAVAWREYEFLGGNAGWLGHRPRLPYPRLDGLHLKTYEAFLGAVEACLGSLRVADLFHVRLMPVTNRDKVFDKQFRPMRELTTEDDGLIVYREGSLVDRTIETCSRHAAMGDIESHVFPGISCRIIGCLRKLDGNCHDDGCCGAAMDPVAGYHSVLVPLKDINSDLAG